MEIRRNAVRTRRVQQGYIIEDVTLPTTLEQELLEKCIFSNLQHVTKFENLSHLLNVSYNCAKFD